MKPPVILTLAVLASQSLFVTTGAATLETRGLLTTTTRWRRLNRPRRSRAPFAGSGPSLSTASAASALGMPTASTTPLSSRTRPRVRFGHAFTRSVRIARSFSAVTASCAIQLADIETARRGGYAYYGTWPASLLDDTTRARGSDSQHPANSLKLLMKSLTGSAEKENS